MRSIDWNDTAHWGNHVHTSATGSHLDAEPADGEVRA